MKNVDSVDQDQTARTVQSDHDLHCPQKLLVSSSVREKLNIMVCFQDFSNPKKLFILEKSLWRITHFEQMIALREKH